MQRGRRARNLRFDRGRSSEQRRAVIARLSPLRVVLALLALGHTYPVRRHLALLWTEPSFGEAWKGFGPLIAIIVFCLPVRWYANGLRALLKRRALLCAGTAALIAAHLVPATEHVPAFLAHPSWADGWRGVGAATAVVWFILPLAVQGRIVGALRGQASTLLVRKIGAMLVPKLPFIAVIGIVFAAGAFAGALHIAKSSAAPARAEAAAPPVSPIELHVPRAGMPIKLDGELDESAWDTAARTGPFVRGGDGQPARPYSEARITWRDATLYVGLYAADEDIRSSDTAASQPIAPLDDAFNLFFEGTTGARGLDVSASGSLFTRKIAGAGPWDALPTAGHDADGTPNDPSDDDEEWVIEAAIPLRELGLRGEKGERFSFAARRCDTPKKQRRTCGAWGAAVAGVLVLD